MRFILSKSYAETWLLCCSIGKLSLYEAIKVVKKDQNLFQVSEFSLVQDGLVIVGAGD